MEGGGVSKNLRVVTTTWCAPVCVGKNIVESGFCFDNVWNNKPVCADPTL